MRRSSDPGLDPRSPQTDAASQFNRVTFSLSPGVLPRSCPKRDTKGNQKAGKRQPKLQFDRSSNWDYSHETRYQKFIPFPSDAAPPSF